MAGERAYTAGESYIMISDNAATPVYTKLPTDSFEPFNDGEKIETSFLSTNVDANGVAHPSRKKTAAGLGFHIKTKRIKSTSATPAVMAVLVAIETAAAGDGYISYKRYLAGTGFYTGVAVVKELVPFGSPTENVSQFNFDLLVDGIESAVSTS